LISKPTADDAIFDEIMLEAIDEALSVCGEKPKSAFYLHLEKALKLPKREIPARIDEFSNALEDIFGLGSRYLEILIMKNLYSKIGVAWGWKASRPWVLPDLTFKEYCGFVKKYFEDVRARTNILVVDNVQMIEVSRATT
jgi:hypothetical protein